MTYKILYTADLHGNKQMYDKLIGFANSKKDLKAVIIGGDLCPKEFADIEEGVKGQKEFLENYLPSVIKQCKQEVFLMMGNDDFAVNMPILEKEAKKGTFKLMHNKKNKLHKFNLVGYSFVNETPFRLKDWEKKDNKDSKQILEESQVLRTVKEEKGTIEEDLKKLKKLNDPKKTIYVIHAPPFNTDLDVISTKENVGSKSVREFIEKEQPVLTLHGHIHESPTFSGEFKDKIGNTVCINPGSEHMDSILNVAIIDIDNLEDIEHEMI